MTLAGWLAVAVLGGIGAVARFLIDTAISRRSDRSFPLGTFLINVTGAFLLGLLSGLALTTDAQTLLGTAMLGSYTTFSTWMLETHRLREDSEFGPAGANIVVSLIVGLAAVAAGHALGVQL